jgi:predicted PurR-regulated permease PerM
MCEDPPVDSPLLTATNPVSEIPLRPSAPEIVSWSLAAVGLLLILHLHLLSALLGGLAVYELVHILSRRLRFINGRRELGKRLAVLLLAVLVVAVLVLAVVGLIAFFRTNYASFPTLLAKMADILDASRQHLPSWLASKLPADAQALQQEVVGWLRRHAGELQIFGADIGRIFLHVLVGMVIGALVSLHEAEPSAVPAPLARALGERARRLGDAFRRIVFAQVRISALNTALTFVYLVVVLPLAGVRLPLTTTLIIFTFLTGLLPVAGNLISNTVIVIVSLSASLGAAAGSLLFLIVIHKLEYFLNAKIVGGEIHARAWEILLAMLLMESAFGIAGLIAAPIYYAYLKDELSARGLV